MTRDIREELAKVIRENRSIAKVMGDGYVSVMQAGDEEIADAILASPLLRRIRAEAWDEGFDKGHYVNAEESRDCGCNTNPYREEEA
jgi:ArsR family metal-binding transcriptional regulator